MSKLGIENKKKITYILSTATSKNCHFQMQTAVTNISLLLLLLLISAKGCMALCVDNMQRLSFGNPLEIVEMFVTVFCFLKDSSQVSQILMDDFRASQGYIFLSDFLLK